jgi:hypothetical protein
MARLSQWGGRDLFTCSNYFFLILRRPEEGGVSTREEVFMEGPIEPNMGPSLADVLLCTFESTNAGVSSFPVKKLLS